MTLARRYAQAIGAQAIGAQAIGAQTFGTQTFGTQRDCDRIVAQLTGLRAGWVRPGDFFLPPS